MKAIIILFDSLNKRYLPPYGCEEVEAPSFLELGQRCTVFDNSYVSSMPCIPARRDMHTGRPHFLHREWGPLEPYDQSVFSILKKNGIYSHLITDHYNYWEEGGTGYHTKYSTFEFIRGQEGDRCLGRAAAPEIPEVLKAPKSHAGNSESGSWKTNWVNRGLQNPADKETYPLSAVFRKGAQFLRENASEDNWVLQIESFSPHEPFLVPDEYREKYKDEYQGPVYDWPRGKVEDYEDNIIIEHIRSLYKSLVTACDDCLGQILHLMDELDLWKDTLLIVGADHGILLGEHGYWSKNVMPYYNEIANTPLFIHDPRYPGHGQHRKSLVQMIDWAPTLLDFFGIDDIPDEMTGAPLNKVLADDEPVRDSAIYGVFSGHVNIVDERYIYMRAARPGRENCISNYTLLPLHMFRPFYKEELSRAQLTPSLSYTQGCPLLKIPSGDLYHVAEFGNLLFERKDIEQRHPLVNPKVETQMCQKLVQNMRALEAPKEQYYRLGLD